MDDHISASANARAAFIAEALRAAKVAGATVPGFSRLRLQELAKQFDAAVDINRHALVRAPGLGSTRRGGSSLVA